MATGMMHGIKESLYPGDNHVDAEYDTAIARYQQLDKLTRTVKEAATCYCNAHYTTLNNSNIASESFAAILEDPLSETGFETLAKQMLAAHSQLSADRQSALTAKMSESVLVPLEKLHLHLLELHTKSTKREELHKNLQYYLRKVGQLVRDREERGAKGKTESDSQKDKLTRNQLKLDTVRQQYTQYTQPLIVELSAVWNTRANYLGPVLAAFASVEKEFARVYSTALDEVHTEVVESAQAKRTNSVLPAVEGSSLMAPQGLDATPIHTGAVGTVNATQSMLVQKAQDPTAINVSSVAGLAPVENTFVSGNTSTASSAPSSTVAPIINEQTHITAHGSTSAPVGLTSGEQLGSQPAPSKKTQRAAIVNEAQAQVTQPGVIVTEKDASHAIQQQQKEEQRKEDEAKRARELQEKQRQLQLEEQNSSITLATQPEVVAPAVPVATATVAVPVSNNSSTTTIKSAHEDESKAQRFEQDQKTAQII